MFYEMSWVWLLIIALGVGALVALAIFMLTDDDGSVLAIGTGVVVALLAFAIPMAIRESKAYDTWCRAQGGHVDSSSQVVSTVGADGKPGVGTSTTTFCLSADGRIIDIQG